MRLPPPLIVGHLEESGREWKFKVGSHYSLFKAKTRPTDAASRIRCLEALAQGLSISSDKLSQSSTSEIRTIRDSDLTALDSSIVDWIRGQQTLLGYFADRRMKYEEACLGIEELCQNPGLSEKDRFLNTCIKINLLAANLTWGKIMHDISSMLLWVAGRENESTDAEIERQAWTLLLQRKYKTFCRSHEWQRLNLEVAFTKPLPPRSNSELVMERITSFLAMSDKDWLKLVDPVQHIVDDRMPSTIPMIEPNRLQRAISLVHSLTGTKKEDHHHATPATCGTESGTGIDCPICSMDLYESVPDDFYKLEKVEMPAEHSAPASTGLRDSVVNFIQTVAINLWVSTPTTTTKAPSTTPGFPRYVPTCEDTCKETAGDWWVLSNTTVAIPPRPVFCPTCRKGFHVTCLWEWLRGRRARSRSCPFCQTNLDRAFVQGTLLPALQAERHRKRNEQSTIKHAESKVQLKNE
ncbi:hypothetical protein LTR84_005578 [Exophiala bonariae]|uniref:RING-type domain-containing protein n=1 Tax=Exophiala bonariae TaxID=1690606 RepID=A0AAV9N6S2_9EURO|nr:hypothetical protein LTR84_005578 [Exophiala bonariae]